MSDDYAITLQKTIDEYKKNAEIERARYKVELALYRKMAAEAASETKKINRKIGTLGMKETLLEKKMKTYKYQSHFIEMFNKYGVAIMMPRYVAADYPVSTSVSEANDSIGINAKRTFKLPIASGGFKTYTTNVSTIELRMQIRGDVFVFNEPTTAIEKSVINLLVSERANVMHCQYTPYTYISKIDEFPSDNTQYTVRIYLPCESYIASNTWLPVDFEETTGSKKCQIIKTMIITVGVVTFSAAA